jgi:hypothetical protein
MFMWTARRAPEWFWSNCRDGSIQRGGTAQRLEDAVPARVQEVHNGSIRVSGLMGVTPVSLLLFTNYGSNYKTSNDGFNHRTKTPGECHDVRNRHHRITPVPHRHSGAQAEQ